MNSCRQSLKSPSLGRKCADIILRRYYPRRTHILRLTLKKNTFFPPYLKTNTNGLQVDIRLESLGALETFVSRFFVEERTIPVGQVLSWLNESWPRVLTSFPGNILLFSFLIFWFALHSLSVDIFASTDSISACGNFSSLPKFSN